jgi:hypothetical protein
MENETQLATIFKHIVPLTYVTFEEWLFSNFSANARSSSRLKNFLHYFGIMKPNQPDYLIDTLEQKLA